MSSRTMNLRNGVLVAGVFAVFPISAFAQQAVPPKSGKTTQLGEIVVTGAKIPLAPQGALVVDPQTLDGLRPATSDTATLMRDIPGVSLQGAGGVSSLPAIHGLADDRVRTEVDGMALMPACPNHMNPALSYIAPSGVKDIVVYAGVTPVSVGGDSIGGTIQVKSPGPEFSRPGEGVLTKGQVGTFYRSNGNGRGANVDATVASDRLSVTYRGSTAQSDNYTAGGDFKSTTDTGRTGHTLPLDEVGSSAYESTNQSVALAMRSGSHQFQVKYAHQYIPYEAFPNQRMDMTDNKNDAVKLGYDGQYQWGELEASAYQQTTDHQMQFGDDKQYWYGNMSTTPGMPMNTSAKDIGARVKATVALSGGDLLRLGGEYVHYTLDDQWPASGTSGMMQPNAFQNINEGKRDRIALYGEWKSRFAPRWSALFGVRHETVKMDTGDVHGYSTMSDGMTHEVTDSTAFNSKDHGKTDQNWDFSALATYTPDATQSYKFGLAQKTRSPNLYERYAWSTWSMAAVMNNFAGDGNGYVGNLELKPEVAHTLSVTADWHDAAETQWDLRVAPYYTRVQDYIDAQCLPGTTCTARQFNVLQYVNRTAELYGVDLSGHFPLADTRGYGKFTAKGVVNYVRGKDRTTGDNLYNIMPLNAMLAVVQQVGRWTNTVEMQLVDKKKDVSSVRNEIATGGYGLLNLRGSYQWKRVRLNIGVENLLDRSYALPLGGAYVGQGTTMKMNKEVGGASAWGIAVPGPGRSIYAGLNISF